ncbi:MAG: type IV toxin-antitoxin system AbiEi family antitoxin domain-containing protein, partial [Frankiales bacterium]|nr:type IV toxin-antitoxin system AbiEi family antitoxin domain-containing protein [Frankiales bacterium]
MQYDDIARSQHGLLTVQQARASGLSRGQLRTLIRRGGLRVVDGRCLSVAPAPTEHKAIVRERALAALLRLPPATRITCVTAAELFGWERSGLMPDDGLVHVYLPREQRRSAPAGVRVHVGPPVEQCELAWDVR